MNWDAIGAISETIGVLGVFVSILYLAIQIRSNTRATKARASFDATHSWATSNEQVPQFSDQLLEGFNKSYDPKITQSELSDVENVRIGAHNRALFQKLEGQYYLYKYGYLEPSIWRKRSAWASGLIRLPYYQTWWNTEIKQNIYSDEFSEAILLASPVEVTLPGIKDKPSKTHRCNN